jgi:CheY-like chemotaxis protein
MNSIESRVILIGEDNDDDVVFLREAIRKAGIVNPTYRVRDGEALIQYLSGQGVYTDREPHPIPFLIVLDLKMPRTNGFEALAWIRQRPIFRHITVIMLSGSFLPDEIIQAYDLGANSFLAKPTELNHLIELMADVRKYWLHRHRDALYESCL